MTIAVTGANSSVGLNLLGHVIERGGPRVLACVRSSGAAAALPASALVEVRTVSYDAGDELAKAMGGASSVVHLAGILIESKRSDYAIANVGSTEAVVAAARRIGVGHILLVSVVGASPDSSNGYLRSKGEAERLVSESGIPATIVRTPILLGPGTAGSEALVRAVANDRVALLGGGRHTMRPLDLDDLSEALLNACAAAPDGVVVHELVGPEPITHRALVGRAAERVGRTPSIGTIPIRLAKLGAAVTSRLKGGGITPTVIDVITADEVVRTNADEALGVRLTPLSTTLDKIFGEERTEG